MKTIVIVSISCLLIGCANHKKGQPERAKQTIPAKSAGEILSNYFSNFEMEPAMIVNNIGGNQTRVQLSNHTIRWIDSGKEIRIKIDNDLFTLRDKITLNDVEDEAKDSINFVNNWDQVKLFRSDTREVIGIRMSFQPCTGRGCSVDYFLIYDVSTKIKNFFGAFRTDNELALYNFGQGHQFDYISKTYRDEPNRAAAHLRFIYNLYSMNNKGDFVEQVDSSGQPYKLSITTFPNDSTKGDEIEQHWLTVIK